MRSEGYGSWVCLSVCVCVCVCVSLQHLTFRAYSRPENHITYSTGNEGHNICGVFSETPSLRRSSHSLRCTASVQCEGTHNLGIGFSRFKKANNRPRATWNTSQCEIATYCQRLYVSVVYVPLLVIVSVFCLAIFRITFDTH